MTSPENEPRRETISRVLRFGVVQRACHWANAALFGVLMVTALDLYYGSLFGLVLERHTVAQIHLWTGLALPVPVAISLLGPWGRAMRDDLRRVNYWTRDEVRWLWNLGRTPLRAGKFNPGQKLNAIFIAAAGVVMLGTGAMLQWFRFFSVTMRSGATFVHDVFALAIFVVVIGHVIMALTHREALRSMFTGWISDDWVRVHASRWSQHDDANEPVVSTASASGLGADERLVDTPALDVPETIVPAPERA